MKPITLCICLETDILKSTLYMFTFLYQEEEKKLHLENTKYAPVK